MRILALSPHPDDIELGCGGFLWKNREEEIYSAYFSQCEKSLGDLPKDTLTKESKKSVDMLGAEIISGGHTVRDFPHERQSVLEGMINLRDELQPGVVLIPSGSDIHQDHRVIHDEALRAFKFVNMLAYELPWNCRAFNPNFFVPLTDKQVKGKLDLIDCYQSQKDRPYFNYDSIMATLRLRGGQCGHEYAEAFELITWID